MNPTDLVNLLSTVPVVGPYVAPAVAWGCVVITVASAIDAAFPQPPAGSIFVPVRKVISTLALCRGYARNAFPAGAPAVAVQIEAAAEKLSPAT